MPSRGQATPAEPLEPEVEGGIRWLVAAENPSGGWGDLSQPGALQAGWDPATTAFVTLALVRAGHTPAQGDHQEVVGRATVCLVRAVEAFPESQLHVVTSAGSLPQTKLGPLVNTGLTTIYLARVLPELPAGHALATRTDAALDKCLRRVMLLQQADGSWTGRHCITSRSFCTAAAVQCILVDRDKRFLVAIADVAAEAVVPPPSPRESRGH